MHNQFRVDTESARKIDTFFFFMSRLSSPELIQNLTMYTKENKGKDLSVCSVAVSVTRERTCQCVLWQSVSQGKGLVGVFCGSQCHKGKDLLLCSLAVSVTRERTCWCFLWQSVAVPETTTSRSAGLCHTQMSCSDNSLSPPRAGPHFSGTEAMPGASHRQCCCGLTQ